LSIPQIGVLTNQGKYRIITTLRHTRYTRKTKAMTTQQAAAIANINNDLASDRAAAELNSRPALTLKAQATNLYHAMMAAKSAGNLSRARELAIELKPLMSELD
jgi:hypothetical protein